MKFWVIVMIVQLDDVVGSCLQSVFVATCKVFVTLDDVTALRIFACQRFAVVLLRISEIISSGRLPEARPLNIFFTILVKTFM